jgi:hypothetical protein
MGKHIVDRIAPEPDNEEDATPLAFLRHSVAAGIHWMSRRRAQESRYGINWIGGTEWDVYVANEAANTYLAMAFRALMDAAPERAEQFAREIHYVNVSAEGGEVLWGLAEVHDVDAQAIHDAALAPVEQSRDTP